MQTDYLIPARSPDLVPISGKQKGDNLPYRWFYHSSELLSENQRKQKEIQQLEPYQRTKKPVEHESDCDTNCSWYTWNGSRRFGREQ